MGVIASTRELYLQTLPERPYCTSRLGRLLIRSASRAVGYSMIQHNSPLMWRWMVFDIDGDDSFTRAEDRGCPPPTFIALNPENGHGHAAYLLQNPVSAFEKSSRRAMRFFEDVERGFTYKLGADPAYASFLSKNPLSTQWKTAWQAAIPYQLETLNDYLTRADKRKAPKREESVFGRNSTVFDAMREIAYRQCLDFKKRGKSVECLSAMLCNAVEHINRGFPAALSHAEMKGIARSVAKWVWEKFSAKQFSALQQARGRKRWSKTVTLSATKPWEQHGISRRTWERRRKQGQPSAE